MSGFSRSIRSPSRLSPRTRPAMSGRSMSNSSERCMDGTTATTAGSDAPPALSCRAPSSSRSNLSTALPITIDPPRAHRGKPFTVQTPSEQPLSARGDLPGGYFPNHEDPAARIHNGNNNIDAIKRRPRATTPSRRAPTPTTTTAVMGADNIPVTSYFPTGYHDHPLPIGKYYPSNYESANSQSSRISSAPATSVTTPRSPTTSGLAGSPGIPTTTLTSATGTSPSADLEARQRRQLQQYQRDMIAQASRATSDLIGSSDRGAPPQQVGAPRLRFPGMDGRFPTPGLHKPNSPRLHPLGSPGPVTPMELEESSGDSYLDKGKGDERRPLQGLVPPAREGLAPRST